MFRGTPKVPDQQFDAIVTRNGSQNNASTSYDRTVCASASPGPARPDDGAGRRPDGEPDHRRRDGDFPSAR